MPLPGPSCGMSVRLPSPGRSLLTHAHICESINIALTRNLFDDRSESAWHFLNSGWHSPAGSGSQLQSGARSRGSGELAGMRTRSHPHSAPRLGDPAAQAGWLSRFLEGEKGPGRGLPFQSRVVILLLRPPLPPALPAPGLPLSLPWSRWAATPVSWLPLRQAECREGRDSVLCNRLWPTDVRQGFAEH